MYLPRLVTKFALESSSYPISFSPSLALLKSAVKAWLDMTDVNTTALILYEDICMLKAEQIVTQILCFWLQEWD